MHCYRFHLSLLNVGNNYRSENFKMTYNKYSCIICIDRNNIRKVHDIFNDWHVMCFRWYVLCVFTEDQLLTAQYKHTSNAVVVATIVLCYYVICCNHYGDVIMGAIASQITSLTIVYSTVYSDADQRKHQSSASLAFVRGIHRRPVNFPHKWPVTRKMFPFDDVIMYSDKLVLWSHDIFVFDSVKWRVMTYPWVGRRLSAHLNLNGRELCGRRCHVHIQRGFPTKAHPSWHMMRKLPEWF